MILQWSKSTFICLLRRRVRSNLSHCRVKATHYSPSQDIARIIKLPKSHQQNFKTSEFKCKATPEIPYVVSSPYLSRQLSGFLIHAFCIPRHRSAFAVRRTVIVSDDTADPFSRVWSQLRFIPALARTRRVSRRRRCLTGASSARLSARLSAMCSLLRIKRLRRR